MNTDISDNAIQVLERRVSDLNFGLKTITVIFLLTASVGDILSAFSIASFRQIFNDALPGHDLPQITSVTLACETAFKVSAFLWPLIGIGALFIRNNSRLVIIILAVVLSLTLLQSGFIVAALRLPMTGLIQGMSQNPADSK